MLFCSHGSNEDLKLVGSEPRLGWQISVLKRAHTAGLNISLKKSFFDMHLKRLKGHTPPVPTLPKLPLPRTLIKWKSLRVLLWTCPSSLPAVDEDEVVDEEEEEEECWGPC